MNKPRLEDRQDKDMVFKAFLQEASLHGRPPGTHLELIVAEHFGTDEPQATARSIKEDIGELETRLSDLENRVDSEMEFRLSALEDRVEFELGEDCD